MESKQYKIIIARIIRVLIKKHFPELRRNQPELMLFSAEAARTIHARMYGANVDGVDSPIWNSGKKLPFVEASELLKVDEICKITADEISILTGKKYEKDVFLNGLSLDESEKS